MKRRVSHMYTFRFLTVVFLLVIISAVVSAADLYIVAHRNVADKELNKETIERIFLGKKSRWSNGEKLIPVMLKQGSLHERFVKKMVNRDATQFNTYWKQAVFTGRGLPPKSFNTINELLDYIAKTPGSIGYSDSPPENESVIIIKVR